MSEPKNLWQVTVSTYHFRWCISRIRWFVNVTMRTSRTGIQPSSRSSRCALMQFLVHVPLLSIVGSLMPNQQPRQWRCNCWSIQSMSLPTIMTEGESDLTARYPCSGIALKEISRRNWFLAAFAITFSDAVATDRVLAASTNNEHGAAATMTPTPTTLTDEEKERIRQRILERRQLMQASKSTNSRQDYLDLSRQRAALYNTTYRGVTCPPNIPCL